MYGHPGQGIGRPPYDAYVWPLQPDEWQASTATTLGLHVATAARGLASQLSQRIGRPSRPKDWLAVTVNPLDPTWPSWP